MNKNYSNSIIIGGPIAVGKSTLVSMLAKNKGWNKIDEFDINDELNEIVLQKLYQGERIDPATMQAYFLLKRYYNYKNNANSLVTSIFDRGIWEDWLFSKQLMAKQEPKSYEHYKKLWNEIIKQLLSEIGYPKAYIFLTVNWDYFRKRIFNRGRESEIANFAKNEAYFKALLDDYNLNFHKLLKEWDLNVIFIDTNNVKKDQVLQLTIEKLSKMGIE